MRGIETSKAKPSSGVRKLRRWLIVFFIALAIPTGILIYKAFDQLKWQSMHQSRELAEELTNSIRRSLDQLMSREEDRSYTEYTFLNVTDHLAKDAESASFIQRSPLAVLPESLGIPGLVGFFQVDSNGVMSSPLLPAFAGSRSEPDQFGMSPVEWQQRHRIVQAVRDVLSANQLVRARTDEGADDTIGQAGVAESDKPTPGDASASHSVPDQDTAVSSRTFDQTGFDQLSNTRKKLEKNVAPAKSIIASEDSYQAPTPAAELTDEDLNKERQEQGAVNRGQSQSKAKQRRRETNALPESVEGLSSAAIQAPSINQGLRVRTFESEIDPFEFGRLNDTHYVLYRNVWRDGQRFIQGLLLASAPFIEATIRTPFRGSVLSTMNNLTTTHQGRVVDTAYATRNRDYLQNRRALSGQVLYQAPLSTPFEDLQMRFDIVQLPQSPGGGLIAWLAGILSLFLCGGCYVLYRLGRKQIDLAQQQQDFVAAVSHELKTPLTSIRMYAEMLREGWTPKGKLPEYYNYIHDESERLSRLINNVLQLARFNREDIDVNLEALPIKQVLDVVQSKVASQLERAGYTLLIDDSALNDGARLDTKINVDLDHLTQVMINLIDNAIKFSAASASKQIDIAVRTAGQGRIQFGVRDYGPGIDKGQMKKIFRLFYRSEDELTRETTGTGIGLALVKQLVSSMNGDVDVVNRDAGAEFLVTLQASAR